VLFVWLIWVAVALWRLGVDTAHAMANGRAEGDRERAGV
jgi:hypothetical protein